MARPTLLVFPVLLGLLAHTAAYITPIAQFGQAALHLLNSTVYVYGGVTVGNIPSLMYSLDVSISWDTANPAWTNVISYGGTVHGPATEEVALFPAFDGMSFYVWAGTNLSSNLSVQDTFAQYTPATQLWSWPNAIANMPKQPPVWGQSTVTSSLGVAYIYGGAPALTVANFISNIITFDTVKMSWNITNVFNTPRVNHVSIMLPTNQMVVFGGSYEFGHALMSDVVVFDTNVALWVSYNATGSIPVPRQSSTAVLTDDGSSILMFGGYSSTGAILNDIAILNTVTMQWSQPSFGGIVPAARYGASSVLVKGQMIIFFGSVGEGYLNDVAVLDTRQTPYAWVSSFVPNRTLATSGTRGLSAVGGVGGVAGIAIGALFIVTSVVFLVFYMRRRRRNHFKVSDGAVGVSSQYNHSMQLLMKYDGNSSQYDHPAQNSAPPSPPYTQYEIPTLSPMLKPDNANALFKPDNANTLSKPDSADTLSKPDNADTLSKPDNAHTLSKPDDAHGKLWGR